MSAGRISVTGQERDDGGFNYTYQDYTARNELYRVWGDVPQPTEYGYDSTYGDGVSLSTFQGGSGWSGTAWPGNTGQADTTTWSYHPATGLLEHKTYADTTAIDYTYTADGRTKTRTWARSSSGTRITTTYTYFGESQGERNTGEAKSITHSDGTPSVTYAYTRSGRLLTVVDDAGTHTFGYDSATLLPTTESFTGGLFPGQVITRQYEALGSAQPSRFSGIQVGGTYAAQYGYAADGRLQWVRGPGLPTSGTEYGAYYTYVTNSDLVGLVEIKDAGVAQAETVRQYETTRDLLDYVENRWLAGTPTTVSKYDYTNDTLGRRTRILRSGDAFSGTHYDDLGYNPRNELESSDRFTGSPPGTPQSAQDFAYLYDHIGNRTSYTPGTQSPPTTYTANALNQYTATQNPAESFTHDLDGNLTQDGSCAYVWNAENRLVEVTPLNPTTGAQKVVNRYDYLGRRVQKQVWTWNGANWGASPTAERRFVYDGRLLLLELDGLADNAALRKYTWGLDLSGLGGSLNDRRTAGGIGGLLATEDTDPGTQQTDGFFYFYDANGNVGQVLGTAAGTIAVKYEYDPYGNRTNTPTQGEFDQPFRFSTKYFDAETGLYDFGYRFYSPRVGRWTSRDPIGETGGLNVYTFVANAPSRVIDPLGRDVRIGDPHKSGTLDVLALLKQVQAGQGVHLGTTTYQPKYTNTSSSEAAAPLPCVCPAPLLLWVCVVTMHWEPDFDIRIQYVEVTVSPQHLQRFPGLRQAVDNINNRTIEHEEQHAAIATSVFTPFDSYGAGISCGSRDAACAMAKSIATASAELIMRSKAAENDRQQRAWDEEDYPKVLEYMLQEIGSALKQK